MSSDFLDEIRATIAFPVRNPRMSLGPIMPTTDVRSGDDGEREARSADRATEFRKAFERRVAHLSAVTQHANQTQSEAAARLAMQRLSRSALDSGSLGPRSSGPAAVVTGSLSPGFPGSGSLGPTVLPPKDASSLHAAPGDLARLNPKDGPEGLGGVRGNADRVKDADARRDQSLEASRGETVKAAARSAAARHEAISAQSTLLGTDLVHCGASRSGLSSSSDHGTRAGSTQSSRREGRVSGDDSQRATEGVDAEDAGGATKEIGSPRARRSRGRDESDPFDAEVGAALGPPGGVPGGVLSWQAPTIAGPTGAQPPAPTNGARERVEQVMRCIEMLFDADCSAGPARGAGSGITVNLDRLLGGTGTERGRILIRHTGGRAIVIEKERGGALSREEEESLLERLAGRGLEAKIVVRAQGSGR